MTGLPTCVWKDPDTQKVCDREVKMATMRPADNTFGPYLCSDHVKRVNDDRDEMRELVTGKGYAVADDPATSGVVVTHPSQPEFHLLWDPVAGQSVRDIADALR